MESLIINIVHVPGMFNHHDSEIYKNSAMDYILKFNNWISKVEKTIEDPSIILDLYQNEFTMEMTGQTFTHTCKTCGKEKIYRRRGLIGKLRTHLLSENHMYKMAIKHSLIREFTQKNQKHDGKMEHVFHSLSNFFYDNPEMFKTENDYKLCQDNLKKLYDH